MGTHDSNDDINGDFGLTIIWTIFEGAEQLPGARKALEREIRRWRKKELDKTMSKWTDVFRL
jgi:hypothetical protein